MKRWQFWLGVAVSAVFVWWFLRGISFPDLWDAIQHAQLGILSSIEYENFGKHFDLNTLKSAQDLWLNMLHLHGINIMFAEFIKNAL